MTNPLISVILPVYNREKYIEDAINSILDQSLDNFELIIIDDGSVDGTVSKIRTYTDNRIKFFQNQKNRGVAFSRNIGIKKARGTFIALMDSDDISKSQRFAKQVNIFNNNPDISICGSWMEAFFSGKLIKQPELDNQIKAQLFFNCSINNNSVMYRRKALQNLFFDKNFEHGEDYEFWIRASWKRKFYNIQESLVRYRYHDGQLTQIFKNEQEKIGVNLRLALFKKINYSQEKYPDEILTKFLEFRNYFTLGEMQLFLTWLDHLRMKNLESAIYPAEEFSKVIDRFRKEIIFKVFLTNKNKEITKGWRIKALKYLHPSEIIEIVKSKLKLRIKRV
ncbi:glycosyltransferase [Antarcticibacterium arcticum]|uniref:Glycosyltransferase n=1 Tax=Antarcticibacterium arcticum TaxID=2585771 RepID=A0A5B8YJE8_9FLAO|nr:glycosyltransferase [Antarcticibacterium arcticum]QED37761.1 glycosyltransferase [Antarcticibacterium arcticum]